jgi:hypothetical protein
VASQFLEIVEGNPEISALRKKLLAAKGSPNMPAQMKLGEKVKEALEARKGEREAAVVACLAAQTADLKKNKTFGDPMFANLAILVDKTRQAEVEAALTAYESRYVGQVKMRCVGPLPPCNFLELVITWDD